MQKCKTRRGGNNKKKIIRRFTFLFFHFLLLPLTTNYLNTVDGPSCRHFRSKSRKIFTGSFFNSTDFGSKSRKSLTRTCHPQKQLQQLQQLQQQQHHKKTVEAQFPETPVQPADSPDQRPIRWPHYRIQLGASWSPSCWSVSWCGKRRGEHGYNLEHS